MLESAPPLVLSVITMERQRSSSKAMNLPKHYGHSNSSWHEDEVNVGAAAEVSSKLRNPHHHRTEEALSSLNLFDEDDHDKKRKFRTFDLPCPREKTPICLRSMPENPRMRHKGYEKFEDDCELERRAMAAEEKAQLLSKELELMTPCRIGSATKKGGVYLQQKVIKLCEDKRNLYMEFAYEIRARLSDRSAANEALKLLKNESQMANKEKNSLQMNLENELDRRSSEWRTSMENIRFENRRLRDRVRDLAEQNVASQREVSHLNTVLRVLKGKLSSKEEDAAHLQGQVERLVQNQEDSKSEIGRMQDLLRTASHKAIELEFELREKNDMIGRLEDELRMHLNEIPILRDDLAKLAKEKDLMRQRLERFEWENLRLNRELEACERKMEKLDEDLMLKDGQISILKASHHDSLGDRN